MAGFQVPNLAYLRNIPIIGGRLYEALHGAQKAINTMALQGNLNPDGQVDPPPAIDGVTATAANGVLHVSVQHTAADVRRGVTYYIEHADNPSFINPQIRNIGDSRSFSEFIGSQSRFVRASAAYPGSATGPYQYHGGQATPLSVNGGGAVGPSPYLPSQGSGTGAPGQGGYGPGPIPVRSDSSGFDWRLQRPIASESVSGAQSPGSQGGIGSGGSGGSGGGIVSALIILDVYANWTSGKNAPGNYPLGTLFVISDRNNLTYQVQGTSTAHAWVYYEGIYSVAQSAISAINGYNATVLSAHDTGLQIRVTDYEHVLQWSGSAWTWGAGESGSGYFSDFAVAPTGIGWHTCDGSTGVKYLKADGTTGTVNLPNTASTPAYRKSTSSYSATISAAATPTVTIAAIVPTGTNSAPSLSMNSYTPAGSASAPTFTGSAATITNTTLLIAAGATVVLTSLGGSTTTYTPAGSISAPTFTGTPATLTGTVSAPTFTGNSVTPTGTISLAPGDPVANYQAMAYFRQ